MAETLKGLTIQIGAETTGLSKALEDVNKKSKDTAAELNKVTKLLKFNPKDTTLITQKQKLLGSEVATTKEKLQKLKDVQEQVNQQFKNGDISDGQYRSFQREIVETESKLKHYETELKNTTSTSKKLGETLQKVGEKMSGIGKSLSKGITAPVMAIGAASAAAWSEVDDGLDTITEKTGATGDSMKGLEKSFRSVYSSMPVDAQTAGDAISEVNKQFSLSGKALEDASSQMLKFSKINKQDVTTSTQSAKGAIEAFGLKSKDLNNVLDSVTATAQKTGVGTDKLFDSVTKGAPSLKALKLNFSESVALMGRFEQSGVDGSKALSYLSKAQVVFAKNGKSVSQGLEEVSNKIKNSKSDTEALTLASKYFGTKGATFMVDAIKRGTLNFDGLASSSKNAAGAVTKTLEGTKDPADKFKTSMNNLKLVGSDLAGTFQTAMAPTIDKVTGKLQNFSKWFGNLSPQMQETIIKVAAIAAAVGPALVIGGKVINTVSKTTEAFGKVGTAIKGAGGIIGAITSPIGITMLAIGALIAIGILLWKNWDKIKAKAEEIGAAISKKWNDIKTSTVNTWNYIKEWPGKKLEEAKAAIRQKIADVHGYFANLKLSIPAIGTNALEAVKSKVSGVADKIGGFFNFLKLKIPTPSLPKLPHFSLTTVSKSILGKTITIPTGFDVKWYAKGGILTQPTLFGMNNGSLLGGGEAGREAVVPLSEMYSRIDEMLDKKLSALQPIVYVTNLLDGDEISSKTQSRVSNKLALASKGRR